MSDTLIARETGGQDKPSPGDEDPGAGSCLVALGGIPISNSVWKQAAICSRG